VGTTCRAPRHGGPQVHQVQALVVHTEVGARQEVRSHGTGHPGYGGPRAAQPRPQGCVREVGTIEGWSTPGGTGPRGRGAQDTGAPGPPTPGARALHTHHLAQKTCGRGAKPAGVPPGGRTATWRGVVLLGWVTGTPPPGPSGGARGAIVPHPWHYGRSVSPARGLGGRQMVPGVRYQGYITLH
jgi:hypothetical protein